MGVTVDDVLARAKQLYTNPGTVDIIAIALTLAFEQQLKDEEALLKSLGLKRVPMGKGRSKITNDTAN